MERRVRFRQKNPSMGLRRESYRVIIYVAMTKDEFAARSWILLDALPLGRRAIVRAIHLKGAERRRLLDLGFTVGAQVEAVQRSPLGDPVAYRVRGSLLALRAEQASDIEVEPCAA